MRVRLYFFDFGKVVFRFCLWRYSGVFSIVWSVFFIVFFFRGVGWFLGGFEGL